MPDLVELEWWSTQKHSKARGSLERWVKVGFFSWALAIPLVYNWSTSPKIVPNQKMRMIVSRESEVPKARIDKAQSLRLVDDKRCHEDRQRETVVLNSF